jgi:hypothetical protein
VVGKLQENNKFKSWGRINVGIEVKTNPKQRRGKELMMARETGKGFHLDDGKVVKAGVNEGWGDWERISFRLSDFYYKTILWY